MKKSVGQSEMTNGKLSSLKIRELEKVAHNGARIQSMDSLQLQKANQITTTTKISHQHTVELCTQPTNPKIVCIFSLQQPPVSAISCWASSKPRLEIFIYFLLLCTCFYYC
ncbi:unnamed protein product [Ceratitis capitata]|uniref:(Mediterranean fruit fly) hypothetical protein n=1 Tax=Ceratitis capitata TaxID=7213 RepID=A0A811URZ6_CERCA|nr:unnamed protein product [Ceratitis capitata]